MRFEDLEVGRQDLVARAATALVAVRRTHPPPTIGEAVAQVLASRGFPAPANTVGRWARYAEACQRNGRRSNRYWSSYEGAEQRVARRLARQIRAAL